MPTAAHTTTTSLAAIAAIFQESAALHQQGDALHKQGEAKFKEALALLKKAMASATDDTTADDTAVVKVERDRDWFADDDIHLSEYGIEYIFGLFDQGYTRSEAASHMSITYRGADLRYAQWLKKKGLKKKKAA
jgi:hypothetical protein